MMSFDSLLIHTMNVSRPTSVADLVGGRTVTNTSVYTGAKCRLCRSKSQAREMVGRETDEQMWTVFYDAAVYTLKAYDRITVSSLEYEVIGNPTVSNSASIHHGEAIVRRLR
jgi:hypothetical protein